MRGVREEGAWGGKMNEVLDAVESAEADIQEDLEFAPRADEVGDAQQDQRRARAPRSRATTATATIAARRSPRSVCGRLPFAVRCKDCEEVKENAEQRERQTRGAAAPSALFLDM